MTDVQPKSLPRPAEQQPSRPGAAPTRRAVLAGSGALGATCLLAACGTDAVAPAPAPAGSANPTSGANPTRGAEPTSGAEPTGGGDTSGGGTATRLAAVADVPTGGGVIKGDYVICQPSEGTFTAFGKACTHKGCDVSEVTDGTIICKCHNSVFSIEDGSVKSGPANQPLAAKAVKVDGDNVVAA